MFRRFKEVLSKDETELERYYAYVDVNNRRQVLAWLESIGVRAIIVAQVDEKFDAVISINSG